MRNIHCYPLHTVLQSEWEGGREMPVNSMNDGNHAAVSLWYAQFVLALISADICHNGFGPNNGLLD